MTPLKGARQSAYLRQAVKKFGGHRIPSTPFFK